MMNTGPKASIVHLENIAGEASGGKASGLARLIKINLPVPRGFAVIGASEGGIHPDLLDEAYHGIGGGQVAVRSSATGEDGSSASFAGQYETFLNISGGEELREAINKCVASLAGGRAKAYREELDRPGPKINMTVIVQRMVDARCAGVLFTADPVTMRRDRIVIDAVRGLGDALVSGLAAPDHFKITRDGRIAVRDINGDEPVLDDSEINTLLSQALLAEKEWGCPLDMEWAIDPRGKLYWLQARPITTLEGDLHEFDFHQGGADVYTTSNIGEMMPGAVSPLTMSTTVYGIDRGMQAMLINYGARKKITDGLFFVGIFYGHIFFNLTSMLTFCNNILGSSPDTLTHAICGRPVPELGECDYASIPVRILNSFRYARYIFGAPWRIRRFEKKLASFMIPEGRDSSETYRAIDSSLEFLAETYEMHLQSSAGSGFASGIIEGILTGGKAPSADEEAALADMLAGTGNVESAGILADLQAIIEILASDPARAEKYLQTDGMDSYLWLRTAVPEFNAFMEKNGHRSFRELDIHQPGWGDDPVPLMVSMKAMLGARMQANPEKNRPGTGQSEKPRVKTGFALRRLLKYSHDAIRRREYTKSILVDVTDRFKKSYRKLAAQLAAEGIIDDPELIFFLTQSELGRLAAGKEKSLAEKAGIRRRVHAIQQTFEFQQVFTGRPEPIEWTPEQDGSGGVLHGKPVSRGRVEGTARVVKTLAEASSLRPGEILIAPVTDVGWTPYYSFISGLATDIGSTISHGAVVAREYGLPTVVNLRTATHVFKTGDRVILDGDRGILMRVESDD
ncbi:MAG: PEP-utilizing enzyme [Spirochaetes bacterium]|jgi:pyruvate,water dikinase|nr:PEP-utilizing enzyme [Spirochaetota bacterium]